MRALSSSGTSTGGAHVEKPQAPPFTSCVAGPEQLTYPPRV